MGEKTALILLAEGNEEMEVVIPTDVLRRAGVSTVFRIIVILYAYVLSWLYLSKYLPT